MYIHIQHLNSHFTSKKSLVLHRKCDVAWLATLVEFIIGLYVHLHLAVICVQPCS